MWRKNVVHRCGTESAALRQPGETAARFDTELFDAARRWMRAEHRTLIRMLRVGRRLYAPNHELKTCRAPTEDRAELLRCLKAAAGTDQRVRRD